jgi:hypothetical protein
MTLFAFQHLFPNLIFQRSWIGFCMVMLFASFVFRCSTLTDTSKLILAFTLVLCAVTLMVVVFIVAVRACMIARKGLRTKRQERGNLKSFMIPEVLTTGVNHLSTAFDGGLSGQELQIVAQDGTETTVARPMPQDGLYSEED